MNHTEEESICIFEELREKEIYKKVDLVNYLKFCKFYFVFLKSIAC